MTSFEIICLTSRSAILKAIIDLLIGGPDGLAKECLQPAETKWSLSPLMLPRTLVRVLLAEQLYRALTIIQGYPYHR